MARAEVSDFVADDVTLRGQNAVHDTTVDVDASETPATLRLKLRASSKVDHARSVVTVSVDGTPRDSTSLADALESPWRVGLGRLASGTHQVEVHAELFPLDRDCTPVDSSTWVVIDSESELDYTPARQATAALPTLGADWQRAQVESVQISGSDSPGSLRAQVRLDHAVRTLGFEPQHANDIRLDDAPTIQIWSIETVPDAWSDLSEALELDPSARGVVALEGSEVRLLGRDELDLPRLATSFGSPAFRALCGTKTRCWMGPDPIAGEDARVPTVVAGVTRIAGGNGWEARGEGSHTHTFSWTPPSGATIETWPVIHLPIRWSGLGRMAGDASVVVRMGGRTLASYELTQLEPNETHQIEVRIPKAWWSDGPWRFEVGVTFRRDDVDRCQGLDPNFPWLSVEPNASLQVPHRVPVATGIAGWFEEVRRHPTAVAVAWDASDAAVVAQLGAVLFPLSKSAGGPGFEFSNAETASMLRVDARPGDDGPIVADDHQHLVATHRRLGIPMLDQRSSAYLALEDDTLTFVPAAAAPLLPVPPLGGLVGARAVTVEETWHALDVPVRAETAQLPLASASLANAIHATQSPLVSDQEKLRRWIDIVWLLGSLVVIGLVVVLLRRKAADRR